MFFRKAWLWIPLLCIQWGCIKENPDDCPDEGYSLVFYYPGNGTTDIFPAKIDRVRMFVYRPDGSLVREYGADTGELQQFQGVEPQLAPGDYTVVCWGNAGRYSDFTDTDPLTEGRLYQSQYVAGETIENFDSLYFGRRDIRVPDSLTGSDTVTFVSAHINMEIYIEGYEDLLNTRARGQGLIRVDNISVGYDFAMALTGQESVMYPLWQTSDDDTYIYSTFNLLRFNDDTGIVISIIGADGETRGTVILRDFLRKYGINVEGVNEITVPIRIVFNEVGIMVSVEPWDTSTVTPIPKS